MCIIVAKPKGIELPSLQTLTNCANSNRDGMGIAINKGKVQSFIKKDFINVNEGYDYLKSNATKDDTVIVHFRIGTSGEIKPEFRHPYPINNSIEQLKALEKTCTQVVAHNGILSEYNPVDDNTNDTMQFIIRTLSKPIVKNNLENKIIKMLIEEHIGTDKLAIIDRGKLLLFGKFIQHEGIYYSNGDYEERIYKTYQGYHGYQGYSAWIDKESSDVPEIVEADYMPSGYGFDYECENCGTQKKVKRLLINDIYFLLCKKCRRAVKKGKLNVDELLYNC